MSNNFKNPCQIFMFTFSSSLLLYIYESFLNKKDIFNPPFSLVRMVYPESLDYIRNNSFLLKKKIFSLFAELFFCLYACTFVLYIYYKLCYTHLKDFERKKKHHTCNTHICILYQKLILLFIVFSSPLILSFSLSFK